MRVSKVLISAFLSLAIAGLVYAGAGEDSLSKAVSINKGIN